jgi:hypothetical protein
MNCDQVFDILTRGPFPTGAACDAAVEAHLQTCAECHRLAEALRPALELFQEAVGPDESRDLPGYWCAVATDRVQPAVSFARERAPQLSHRGGSTPARTAGAWSAVGAWRMVAMLALGAIVGSLIGSGSTFDGRMMTPVPLGEAFTPPPPDHEHGPELTVAEHSELAALPAACSRHRPGKRARPALGSDRLLARADLGNLSCCSECHNANSDAAPAKATIQVSRQCQLCHNERSAR